MGEEQDNSKLQSGKENFVEELCLFLQRIGKHIEEFPVKTDEEQFRVLDQLYSFIYADPFVENYWEELGPPGPKGAQGIIKFVKSAADMSQQLLMTEDDSTCNFPESFTQSLQVIPRYTRYWESVIRLEVVSKPKGALPPTLADRLYQDFSGNGSLPQSVEVLKPLIERYEKEETPEADKCKGSPSEPYKVLCQINEIIDRLKNNHGAFLGKMETLVRSSLQEIENQEQKANKRQADILRTLKDFENNHYSILEKVVLPIDREIIHLMKEIGAIGNKADLKKEEILSFIEAVLQGLSAILKDSLVSQGVYLDDEVKPGALFDENKSIIKDVEETDDIQKNRVIKEIGSHTFYRLVENEKEYFHMADVVIYQLKHMREVEEGSD